MSNEDIMAIQIGNISRINDSPKIKTIRAFPTFIYVTSRASRSSDSFVNVVLIS